MLDLVGRHGSKLCDTLSRRTMLGVGALGPLGLGLPQLLSARANAAPSHSAGHAGGFGSAKRVILLFMWGGPAHQDTWDLKPDGPVDLRGEFLPIPTNVPGLHVSEHFPHIANHADKLALIRSVGQEDNNHSTGAHAGLTGRRHERKQENFAASESDFPHYGSVLSKLRPNTGGMPTFVALPDVIATTAGVVTPGQGGGILGRRYDPFRITDHPDEPDFSISSLQLPAGSTLDRFRDRRRLLDGIDDVRRLADRASSVRAMDSFYERALDMVLSPEARAAFRLDDVSADERWRYGMHTFGQSCLLARRLVEAGVQLVTVYWHRERPTIDSSWDTHALNFRELKNRLMPSVDRTLAELLADLERTGLLDDTLVVWNSEFGRTPKVNARGGRDHWGPCNTVVMAGGGVPGGQVYGASDESAAYPVANKVTQDDVAATVYHLLGLDPHETLVHDRLGRPYPVALGQPIHDLIGGKNRVEPAPPPTPLPDRPAIHAFERMLRDRARRFLCLDLGNPGSEEGWTLTGWSNPTGEGDLRNRTAGEKPVTLRRDAFFYGHFDYGFAAFHLAEPASLEGVSLSVNGHAIPIPADLAAAPASSVWQIPFPDGFVKSQNAFELSLTAPGWKLADFALVGDRIDERFLSRLNPEPDART